MNIEELKRHKHAIILDLNKFKREYDSSGTNHILHLLLSCMTFGIWLLVWLKVSTSNASQRNKLKKLIDESNHALVVIDQKIEGQEKSEELKEKKECPWCAELIMSKAILCKHCGKNINA